MCTHLGRFAWEVDAQNHQFVSDAPDREGIAVVGLVLRHQVDDLNELPSAVPQLERTQCVGLFDRRPTIGEAVSNASSLAVAMVIGFW